MTDNPIPAKQVSKLAVAIINKIDGLDNDPLLKAAALRVAAETYNQSASAFTLAATIKGIMDNVK